MDEDLDQLDTEELEAQLIEVRTQHSDLDAAIAALLEGGSFDPLRIQRLKKQKLALKDQIARLESALLPNIIA